MDWEASACISDISEALREAAADPFSSVADPLLSEGGAQLVKNALKLSNI